MADTVNQVNGTETENQGKTFTQDDMNALAGKIRSEEKAKYSDYEELKSKAAKFDEIEEANKTELQKANEKVNELQAQIDGFKREKEVQDIRNKIASEMKVPATLLTENDEESCRKQAKNILEFAKPSITVPDGGEITPAGGTKTTRDQFAEAFNAAIGKE